MYFLSEMLIKTKCLAIKYKRNKIANTLMYKTLSNECAIPRIDWISCLTLNITFVRCVNIYVLILL